MDDNQFSALLTLIVPEIVKKIIENSNQPEKIALRSLFNSNLYKELSDESTKLWHYSPALLYTMYQDELIKGSYDYPEEA